MSTEERSLGDGIESSVDDNSTHKIETYQSDGKFRQQYDYCDSGLPLRGRDTKFDKTRIRSQSLPRKPSTYENFYPKPDVCQLYCENEKRFEEPALKRSSSTDMIESGEQTYGEFHRQTSLRNVSESKRNSSTLKHNYSFEEMRTQLAKQREAPPANIVSQRIKHFESSVETLDDAKKSSPPAIGIGELLTKGSGMESYAEEKREKQLKEPDCVYKITFENLPREDDSKVETIKLSKSLNANPNCISNENKLNWQHSFQRRHFCSDSDVGRSLCKKDSNSTTEDSSIASAPIVLSPLSSVLADLRRTADTKKETKRGGVDEVIITKGALRLSLAESKDMTSDCKSSEDSEVKKMEEEYLSMTKGKLTEDEAVYVAMDDDSTIPLYSSVPKVEPVYNEPVLPPSSFLHDIFGKQKRSKSLGGQLNSYSSSDESSNLYEKPNWKNVKEKASQNKADPTEENPVYEEPYSMTPYRQWDTKAKSKDSSTIEVEESIPDLLNHEENVRKDTDASDADDEASRDFDTPHHNHNGLPSYQKEILCGEHSLTELDNQFDQSRALPLIPKYPTYVVNKITKTEIPVKEAALAVSEATMRYVNSPNEDSAQSLPNDLREYKHFKVYEDERRCTEFVFKSELEKETTLLSPTVNLKQVRIYKEGKEPGKLKFYSHSANQLLENCSQPNTVRSKQKLSLDSQMETQHHLHIKPLHSYSDEASNTTDMSHSAKHAKSSSYDSSLQVKVASYTTPDVVPFEADENSILRKNLSTSAPYYYSDLLPNGLQAPCPQDHGDFHISPRSSRALLNNVRDVSPNQARGDIGRKVNVIQNTPIILNNASANEDSVSVAMARELRASLEQLLSPESKKFLDAERNKYEAGHTLEKTHHSSTLSKLKKRSSTPDFENHNNEPEYENVSATRNTSGNGLTRRLSRSLEGLIDLGPPMEDRQVAQELDLATREEPQLTSIDNEEPFYENIMFVRKENEHFRENDQCEMEMRTSSPYSREWDNNVSLARSDKDMSLIETSGSPDLFPQDIEKRDYGETIGQTLALNSLGDERDSDSEYLDENILRRESQRHFLAQGLGEKTAVGFTNKMKGISVSPKQASVSNPTINTPNSEENMLVETLSYQPQINHGLLESEVRASSCPKTVCREMPDYCGYVSSDSSSDLSFHRDPTSGDSVVATSDEHLSHQRQRHLSEISKDNLNSSDSELHKQTSSKVKRLIQRSQGLSREGKRLSISAGDLLEKSHEELVLLLIQLRRTLARVAKTREKCHAQLESSQLINLTRLGSSDKTLQNYEELKVQIQELERQYDMTQPLVNLVENMVKLGSLYRGHEKKTLAASTAKLMSYTGKDQIYTPSQNLVEFSNNIVGSDTQPENFHQGISCLYELNRGFYAESANLMSLHQDKDMLEYTLDSVKGKVNSAGDNTMLVQKLKKQQLLLEKELTRVRNLLSHSAAKIEELTKENVKQEKDILLLKQKVHQALKKSSLDKMPLARANLESELSRVQSVIEELSQQRMEVVSSIENLKQESQHSISSRSYSLLGPPVRASPTGAAGVIPLPLRRKCQTTYLETDLDSLETRDLACIPSHIYFGQKSDNPLYVNTVEIIDDKLGNESTVESPPESEYYNKNSLMSLESAEADRMFDDFYNSQPNDINEADERMKRFYGIIPREKPSEIKTVRIVKRESERRSRVRKKVSYDENHSLVWLVEEPDTLLSEDGEETDDGVFQEPFQGGQNRPTTLFFPPQAQSSFPSAREQLFGGQTSVCSPSSSSSEFRTPITPLFLLNKPQYPPTSQATTTSTSSLDYRAPFKKAKRRHYTISGSQPTLEQSWIKNNIGGLRSRDDMDMERCLRTVNTPDIVRSTIKKVDVFDEKLIERELSLPQKIVIPERYIEAEPPEELSASEKLRRKLKAETIRKMLSETTTYEDIADENGPTETLRKKLEEEKKKRAHLLALNHTIAKEVMERSKMVAVVATLERLDPKKIREEAKRRRQLEEDIRSPDVPLPLRQQRENFLT